MSTDFDQAQAEPRKFDLGPLGTLNQVIKALGKTIRAMADGSIDSQLGARICNGLGIMRACFEAQGLERLPDQQRRIGKIVHEIVHVTKTQEQIDNENLVVDYNEINPVKAITSSATPTTMTDRD